jgi:hypothetical protein
VLDKVMGSVFCERAIEKAIEYGNALLKFISPNDVGLTGGHQYGYYLPKEIYPIYTPHPPVKGTLKKFDVNIVWMDELPTESVITWYGDKSRNEYRLTRFGLRFPYRAHDMVGNLLVLVRETRKRFSAYVLDLDDDIAQIQATLGVEILESWALYLEGADEAESEDECVNRHFRNFAQGLATFPTGRSFSKETWKALRDCITNFSNLSPDDALMKGMSSEYDLFRMVERQLCQQEIVRVFRDVQDFVDTASTILNRRKSRAGRALENHVEQMLISAKIPHKMRPQSIDGKPDIVIPSEAAYFDTRYPVEKLFIIGVKTTCKDRWRQVLHEGKRLKRKHILTTQKGISPAQLAEMHDANVSLVVPVELHRDYPPNRTISLLSLDDFVTNIRRTLN